MEINPLPNRNGGAGLRGAGDATGARRWGGVAIYPFPVYVRIHRGPGLKLRFQFGPVRE